MFGNFIEHAFEFVDLLIFFQILRNNKIYKIF
jgi:hypothetical protein